MAGPSVAGGAKTPDKDNKIKGLVEQLLYDFDSPYECPRPIDEFGYLNPDGKDNPDFNMRKQVMENQKTISQTFYEVKAGAAPEIKEEYKDYKAKIETLSKAYVELHTVQGEYINNLLRNDGKDLKAFKAEQQDEIKKCEAALDDLKKDLEAKKALEMKAHAPPAPIPATVAELNKGLDSLKEQQKLLKDLPNKIEADRDLLTQKLENQKRRNRELKADIDNNNGVFDKSKIFVPYFDRVNEKDWEKDLKSPPEPRLAGILSASANKKIKAKALGEGYKDSKAALKAEIERMEKGPPEPEEGFFVPLGQNNPRYLIHRFKKDGEWYIEPEMRGNNRLTNSFFSTRNDFLEVVQSIIKFQNAANRPTDNISLSYDKPVTGWYAEERVDQIRDLVRYLLEQAKKELAKSPDDPTRDLSKVKALKIDANSRKALFAYQPSLIDKITGTDKSDEIVRGLKELEGLAALRNQELSQSAKKETTLNATVKGQYDDLNKVVDEKRGFTSSSSVLYNKSNAAAPGAGALGPGSTPTDLLKEILNDNKANPPEEKKQAILNAYAVEKNEIQKLSGLLKDTQEKLNKTILEIEKSDLDPGHKDYESLKNNLDDLQKLEEVLQNKLEERCSIWLEDQTASIAKLAPDEAAYIQKTDYDQFQADITSLKNVVDSRKDITKQLKDDVESTVKVMQDRSDEMTKTKDEGYSKLGKP